MGGAACGIPHLALMHPFVSGKQSVIPTDPKLLPVFDEKLKVTCAQSEINVGFLDAELVDQVCAIMGKPAWDEQDRKALNDMLNSLYT